MAYQLPHCVSASKAFHQQKQQELQQKALEETTHIRFEHNGQGYNAKHDLTPKQIQAILDLEHNDPAAFKLLVGNDEKDFRDHLEKGESSGFGLTHQEAQDILKLSLESQKRIQKALATNGNAPQAQSADVGQKPTPPAPAVGMPKRTSGPVVADGDDLQEIKSDDGLSDAGKQRYNQYAKNLEKSVGTISGQTTGISSMADVERIIMRTAGVKAASVDYPERVETVALGKDATKQAMKITGMKEEDVKTLVDGLKGMGMDVEIKSEKGVTTIIMQTEQMTEKLIPKVKESIEQIGRDSPDLIRKLQKQTDDAMRAQHIQPSEFRYESQGEPAPVIHPARINEVPDNLDKAAKLITPRKAAVILEKALGKFEGKDWSFDPSGFSDTPTMYVDIGKLKDPQPAFDKLASDLKAAGLPDSMSIRYNEDKGRLQICFYSLNEKELQALAKLQQEQNKGGINIGGEGIGAGIRAIKIDVVAQQPAPQTKATPAPPPTEPAQTQSTPAEKSREQTAQTPPAHATKPTPTEQTSPAANQPKEQHTPQTKATPAANQPKEPEKQAPKATEQPKAQPKRSATHHQEAPQSAKQSGAREQQAAPKPAKRGVFKRLKQAVTQMVETAREVFTGKHKTAVATATAASGTATRATAAVSHHETQQIAPEQPVTAVAAAVSVNVDLANALKQVHAALERNGVAFLDSGATAGNGLAKEAEGALALKGDSRVL